MNSCTWIAPTSHLRVVLRCRPRHRREVIARPAGSRSPTRDARAAHRCCSAAGVHGRGRVRERARSTPASSGGFARLVVFPELSLTGYELDADTMSPDDDPLGAIVAACAETEGASLAAHPSRGTTGRSHRHAVARELPPAPRSLTAKRFAWEATSCGASRPATRRRRSTWTRWTHIGLGICKDPVYDRRCADAPALDLDLYVASLVHTARGAADAGRARPAHRAPVRGLCRFRQLRRRDQQRLRPYRGDVVDLGAQRRARLGPATEPGEFTRALLTARSRAQLRSPGSSNRDQYAVSTDHREVLEHGPNQSVLLRRRGAGPSPARRRTPRTPPATGTCRR